MAIRFSGYGLDAEFQREERGRLILASIFVVALLGCALGYNVMAAYFEAASFNRLTGGRATTWVRCSLNSGSTANHCEIGQCW